MRTLLTLGFFVCWTASATAEEIKIVCTPNDPKQTWRAEVQFDLDKWTFEWAAEDWTLTAGDERAVAAQTTNGNWPAAVLIDRETGKFWKVDLGRFCTSKDCSTSELGAITQTGSCSKPF